MKSQRLYYRQRTKELIDKIRNSSSDNKLNFFGLSDIKLVNEKLERIDNKGFDNIRAWDLIEINTQSVIGTCSFHTIHWEHERAEVGYKIYEEFRNKGFMSEALKQIITYGFTEMKLNRIEAFTGLTNTTSKRLLEKFGFIQDGILREHYKGENGIEDSIAFSLLHSEFIT